MSDGSSRPARRSCRCRAPAWSCSTAGVSPSRVPATPSRSRDTPVFDELWASYPHTTLTAWGRAVGLPDGQMGNSEVGHLNLGAGAVVRQDLMRIDDAIADGSLARERRSCAARSPAPSAVHLLGLVSDGGVHSSLDAPARR